jgi:hypothetical protein
MQQARYFQMNIDRIRQRIARDEGRQVTPEQAADYLMKLGFKRNASQWTGPALLALQLRGDEYCMMPEPSA